MPHQTATVSREFPTKETFRREFRLAGLMASRTEIAKVTGKTTAAVGSWGRGERLPHACNRDFLIGKLRELREVKLRKVDTLLADLAKVDRTPRQVRAKQLAVKREDVQ